MLVTLAPLPREGILQLGEIKASSSKALLSCVVVNRGYSGWQLAVCAQQGSKQRWPDAAQIRSTHRLSLHTRRWIFQGPEGSAMALNRVYTYEAIRCVNVRHKKNAADCSKICSLPNYKDSSWSQIIQTQLHKLHCNLQRKRSSLYSKCLIVFY